MVFPRRSVRTPGADPENGAAEAFAQAALSQLDSLYGMAFRLTRRTQDAEDLVQDGAVPVDQDKGDRREQAETDDHGATETQ